MPRDQKTMSRSSFLGSLGTLGLLGSLPFLASACNEPKTKPTIFEGDSQNAIIDNILTRRSIRKYTDQPIPQEVLDTILKCGIFAPSAINSQPWEVRVIQNPDILKEISKRHLDYLRIKKKEAADPENQKILKLQYVILIK
jgi:hypothetical protein